MLEVENINTFYGKSHILFDVFLHLKKGEVVGLLGRNGAGKTTTMKSISGLLPPKRGKVIFEGADITYLKPHKIVRMGLSYVPDEKRIFGDLTVDDNLDIVYKREGYWNKARVYELFPQLDEIKTRRAGFLSGGEKAMLAIGRALVSNPKLLLLDEPTEGLAPLIVQTLEKQIITLKESGISILLSEQNLATALKIVDRAYIIDNGRICYEGTIKELECNEEVKKDHLMV